MEVWSPTFNHELLNEGKVQALTMFMATKEIREFTPHVAAQMFPRAAITSMGQLHAVQGPEREAAAHPTTGESMTEGVAHQGATAAEDMEF